MIDKSFPILLVEDDEVDVMSVRRAFKAIKITNKLIVAGNGLEGLALLRGEGVTKVTPKIILLDINMPRMNGIEFLKELRSDPQTRSISVFVLTTSNEEADKMAAYDLNVAGYIVKPVEADKFVEAVSTLNYYWTLIEIPA